MGVVFEAASYLFVGSQDGTNWSEIPIGGGIPDNAGLYADIAGQVTMPRWHRGRALLLGDAAFAVSLLAGTSWKLRDEPLGEDETTERRLPHTGLRPTTGLQTWSSFLDKCHAPR